MKKKMPRCLWEVTSLMGWLFICKIGRFGVSSLRDMVSDSVFDGLNLYVYVF